MIVAIFHTRHPVPHPHPNNVRGPIVAAWAVATMLALPVSASAGTGELWDLRNVRQGLHERSFALDRRAGLELDVVGAGSGDLDQLHAYGWILNIDSGKVVWRLTPDTAQQLEDDETWGFVGRITLGAGNYVAYFNAIGRHAQEDEELKVIELPWASVRTSLGRWRDWNAYGNPRDWHFRISASDDDAVSAIADRVEPRERDDLLIDFAPLGDNAFESAAFRVEATAEVEVQGTFEYDTHNRNYADHAWLVDVGTGETVWRPEVDDSEPAGGSGKNHAFIETITLEPGEYVLSVLTDDSHSYFEWNESAPWNPSAWGVELRVVSGDGRGATLIEDPRIADRIVGIDRVRSSSFVRRGFRVLKPLNARIEGLAELGKRKPTQLYDYGWIERAADRTIVWTMQGTLGEPAGESPKNRFIRENIRLEPDTYFLCYLTDAGHAFEDWTFTPPRDPDRWGIGLFGDVGADAFEEVAVKDIDPAILTLAPTGDNASRSRVMTLPRAYDLRVVALGEAVGRVLYDLGWIEEADTGKKVWEMKYADTTPAGGASKNRIVDTVIRLQAGRYRVRYKSDGSHAFGSWNADPPNRPEMWGITLYHEK